MRLIAFLAHGGDHAGLEPATLLTAAGLVLAGGGYLAGLRVLAGGDQNTVRQGARRLGTHRAYAFACGMLAVAVALLPPFEPIADQRFSTHMVQHMLLIAVAAPLLALGAAEVVIPLALPVRARRRLAALTHASRTLPLLRLLWLPVTAWLAHLAVLWFWHLPGPYDLALKSDPVHALEHLTFLAGAWLLWWHVTTPTARKLSAPVALLYMFVTAVPSAALGAVLTLAPTPLFPVQAGAAARSGVDPLADQQLAGLVMWVPADVVYLISFVILFLLWMRPTSTEAQR
ncbi:cytochrome c oxidase assembly protein [Sinosporangium siamense]|uniref:Membrane protein n=1 Tax=Sinosporangium siamense TaxID=1367973 RepID=A0A919RIQ3_9ACTN|nr:cytochrome c oxidase assembly protein [Sinosporangium siamense]GII94537.1 membrane protein [Sinosporangium siamense]